jgi:exopolyphosphatase/guanosine-5'-triphosphate,3'-diphosphate pyrophosphatase
MEGRRAALRDGPVAVIDVGSNTGRVIVLRSDGSSPWHLETIAGSRAPLQLTRDLRDGPTLNGRTLDRTIEVLRDFGAIARASEATGVMAVATSAVRESDNAGELVRRALQEAGVRVEVIDGDAEARYSCLGAVYGLPVTDGLLIDIGGGSLEVSSFRDRRFVKAWTLPLGSLRMSGQFFQSDPPARDEVGRLRRFVAATLERAGVPLLQSKEALVGTGGTVRNLAKVDRRARSYPIPRLHGYVLTRERVEALAARLVSQRRSRLRSTPGLTADRADSIGAGAVVADVCMTTMSASEAVVSGQGLREGVFFDTIEGGPPTISEVRTASVAALAARFTTWEPERAARRVAIAAALLDALEPEARTRDRERLAQAASILDVGRSIDYYRRHAHTADILVAADLAGFGHRGLALLAAVVRMAGDQHMRIRIYRPLLSNQDHDAVSRLGTILALADEIEHRVPPGRTADVSCRVRSRAVSLQAPLYDPWRREALRQRFRAAFHRDLLIQPPGGDAQGA